MKTKHTSLKFSLTLSDNTQASPGDLMRLLGHLGTVSVDSQQIYSTASAEGLSRSIWVNYSKPSEQGFLVRGPRAVSGFDLSDEDDVFIREHGVVVEIVGGYRDAAPYDQSLVYQGDIAPAAIFADEYDFAVDRELLRSEWQEADCHEPHEVWFKVMLPDDAPAFNFE